MMTYFKLSIGVLTAVALSACTGASQQTANVESSQKQIATIATVKPGASVTLNSILPKSMTSGTYQTVQLRFEEADFAGTMSVTVEPSEGLSLFGGAASKTFNMAKSDEHIWDIDVKADSDGVYFLNVFAEANGQPRSFSVRLDMGQTTQKMFDDAMPADGELTDGGKIRALEADETIQ